MSEEQPNGVVDQEAPAQKKKPSKGLIISIVVAAIVAISVLVYVNVVKPHDEAVAGFKAAAATVQKKNDELQAAIDSAQQDIDSGDEALDTSTRDTLTTTIANASLAMRSIPEMPESTDGIKAATAELSEPLDYSEQIAELETAKADFQTSVAQLKQVTNPSEDFVISRLGQVRGISDIRAVTEDNDPNRLLNKAGGYTAAVYFHVDGISDPYGIYAGNDSIENGTSGGGCVEVYANTDDANKRNEYLASFDGQGILNPGSHMVLGTCVVRTSQDLTATQQDDMTAAISTALTQLQ